MKSEVVCYSIINPVTISIEEKGSTYETDFNIDALSGISFSNRSTSAGSS